MSTIAQGERYCAGCITRVTVVGPCGQCRWDDATHPEMQTHLPRHHRLQGRYYIGRVLGQGGFGVTYLARDLKLGRAVAIKEYLPMEQCSRLTDRMTIHSHGGEKTEQFQHGLQGFLKEAQALATLDGHANIVAVTDFMEANGTAYLVMTYVEGISLKEYLTKQGGRIPYKTAVELIMPVMDALREIHRHGMLHRDISPSNIMLTRQGQVKLVDFGAARYAIGEHSKSLSMVLKPGYAPEEQYRTRGKQGQWTDVYATAATLYQCITGQTPPAAPDRMVDDEMMPPSAYCPELPPVIEAALLKGMAVRAADRFQSIEEFQQALLARRQTEPPAPSIPAIGAALGAKATGNSRTWDIRPSDIKVGPAVAEAPPPPFVPVNTSRPPMVQPLPPSRKGKGRIALWISLAVVLLLAGAAASYYFFFLPPETVLRLEGSTTVGDELAPRLLEAFLKSQGAEDIREVPGTGENKAHRDVQAKLHGSWRPVTFSVLANGSPNAFTALASSRADIGMASRQIKDEEVITLQKLGNMKSPGSENVVAMDGIAVIVNRNNPVPNLTRQQIGQIFRGNITNWEQVGGQSAPIHLFGRDQESGTFDTFVARVLGGDKKAFAPGLKIEKNGDDIAKEIASDPDGIGYVGLAQIGSNKALPISDGPGTTPLMPSEFTVATEDYILSRRLYLYVPANPTEMARKFVDFALSPDGQKVVADVHYVTQTPHFEVFPIPDDAPADYKARVTGLRRMSLDFRFLPNVTTLDNKALADIPRVVAALNQNGIHNVQVLGFADSKGLPQRNQELSEERARVVADTLKPYGITVEWAGFSSAIPVADNATDEGRNKNRRVEVWAR